MSLRRLFFFFPVSASFSPPGIRSAERRAPSRRAVAALLCVFDRRQAQVSEISEEAPRRPKRARKVSRTAAEVLEETGREIDIVVF